MRIKRFLVLLPLVALLFILVGSQAAGRPLNYPTTTVDAYCYDVWPLGATGTVKFWWTKNGVRVSDKVVLHCDDSGPITFGDDDTYDFAYVNKPDGANDWRAIVIVNTGTVKYICKTAGRFPSGAPSVDNGGFCYPDSYSYSLWWDFYSS